METIRIIDANKVIEELRKDRDYAAKNGLMDLYFERQSLIKKIEAQPTAYDIDKVVEQLEDYGNEETHYYKNTPYERCIEECIGKALKIVKAGGIDQSPTLDTKEDNIELNF